MFIIWLQIGNAREIENFYIAFIFRHDFVRIIKFKKKSSERIVQEEIRVLFNFLLF